jgi:PAS domain S-box-containing protein
MAATVLLVRPGVDRLEHAPSGIALASNDVVEEVARPDEALERLAAPGHGIDALILPSDLDDPLETAQRAHALDPDLAIVVMCEPERCVQVARALEFAPFLGEDVVVLSTAEREALADEIASAIDRVRTRRTFRHMANPRTAAAQAGPAHQYLGELLEHAPIGVVIVEPSGAVIGWNARAGAMLGTSEREIAGTSLAGLFEDSPQLLDLIGQAAVGASAPAVSFERISSAGEPQFVEIMATSLTGRAGEPGVMLLLRDVTESVVGEGERRWMEEALRFQKTLLKSQSEASMEGTLVVSRDGRILSFNRRFGELWGIETSDPALRFGEVAQQALEEKLARPDEFFARLAALADDPHDTEPEELALRDARLFETYSAPVKSEGGAHYGRVWFFHDLTERKRAEERVAYLAEASEILGGSLDYEQTLGSVAKLAIPTLADWCIVDELRDNGIARVAVAAADERKQGLLEELRDEYPPTWDSPQPAARALREGEIVVFEEFTPESLREMVHDERHYALIRDLGPVSALALPLQAHGQTLGTITFAFAESGRRYSSSDISLATEIARRAALAIDRARLYRGEHTARLRAEAAHDRLAFLADASSVLARSLDYEATLARVAALAVPRLADWCIVYLAEPGGRIRRLAIEHSGDLSQRAIVAELADFEFDPDATHGVPSVIRTGEPEFHPVATAALFASDAVERERLEELLADVGIASWMCAPLAAHERILGAITFVSVDPERRYTTDDLALAQELANRAALAVDNARLYSEAQEAFKSKETTFALLNTLLRTAPVGLAFFDSALRYVLLNDALAAINGIAAIDHVGKTVTDVLPDWDPQVVADMRKVLETREPIIDREIAGTTPAAPDVLRHWVTSYYPVELADDVFGIGAVVVEITERKRAEEERAYLLALEREARAEAEKANEILAHVEAVTEAALAHDDLNERLRNLLSRVVGVVRADTAAVLLLNESRDELVAFASIGLEEEVEHGIRIPVGKGFAGRIVARQEPVLIEDVDHADVLNPFLREKGIKSLLGVPLMVGAEATGVLHVGTLVRREFTQDDVRLLQLVAERVALAIEHGRAWEAVRKVETVTEAALANLGLDELLEELLARITTALGTDTAVILLADDAGEELVARAGVGLEGMGPDDVRVPVGRGFAGEVAATARPVSLPDLGEMEIFDVRLKTKGVRSALGVPLLVEGRVTGVLHVGTLRRRYFTDEDARVLQLVADRVALAVERARLFEAEREARADAQTAGDRLAFIAEASAVLSASLEYERTLARVAELAVPRLADWCVVYSADPDGGIRRLAVEHPDQGEKHALTSELAEIALNENANVGVPHVIRSGEPAFYPDASAALLASDMADPDRVQPILEQLGITSWMCVPLSAHGRTLGAISFVSAKSGRRYDREDLALAEDLARRAAVAADNARLYREAQARADAARALETIGDGVLLVDRGGIVRVWNPAAQAITGLPADEVVHRAAAEAIPGWSDIAHLLPVAEAPGRATRPESVPIEIGGREIWLSVSAVGFSEGTVYAFRDLTEERRLDQLKTEFVATASHELRTPLAAVYGAAMTLRRRDFVLDDEHRDLLLSVIADESDRLARIVNDILWASRLDSGEVGIEIKPFDARVPAQRVVEAARTHLPPDVELELSATRDLPRVAADESKVSQVLTNLVENAIKYSPDGGRIELRLEAGEHRFRFSVTDEGIGIPMNEQARIFEKFYRLDPNLTRGVGGTGLGLYICRELVRRMNGRIWVTSREDQGSRFSVELPLAETQKR